jgi:hypothetical protein
MVWDGVTRAAGSDPRKRDDDDAGSIGEER